MHIRDIINPKIYKYKTKYNRIDMKSIVNISFGPQSSTYKKTSDANINPYLCFSIVTIKRTYDFIGDNIQDVSFIVKTINKKKLNPPKHNV